MLQKPNKEQLIQWFIEEKLNTIQIAIKTGYSASSINNFLKHYKIDVNNRYLGKTFGDITVLKYLGSFGESGKQAKNFECQCVCGKKIIRITNTIKYGHSCGCKIFRNRLTNKNFTGYGEIHGTIWKNIKNGAKVRNHCFEITKEYVWNLFLKQERKCFYTNLDIFFPKTTRDYGHGLWTASLDRIDSNVGYIEGNVQWVHKDINLMKQKTTHEDFIKYCKLIAEKFK